MKNSREKKNRFSIQIILISIAVLLIGLVTVSITFYLISRHDVRLRSELRNRSNILVHYLAYNCKTPLLTMDIVKLRTIISGLGRENDITRVLITDSDGIIMASTDSVYVMEIILPDITTVSWDSLPWLRTDNPMIRRTYWPIQVERINVFEENATVHSMSILSTDNNISRETIGYAVIDVSLKNVINTLGHDKRIAFVIALIVIGISSLVYIAIAKYLTDPLIALTEASRLITQGDYNHTVLIRRNDEVGALAESFNAMTEQLKKSREENLTWQKHLEHKVQERTNEVINKHKQLEHAYKELESLDKAKDDFLSLVSHELRTPLSTILVSTEYLLGRNEQQDEKCKRFLTSILEESKRLSRLINDVLDLSKIESGRMPFKKEVLDMEELVSQVITILHTNIEHKDVVMHFDSIVSQIKLYGDKDRVVQVLENVLTNAIKFTPQKGSIQISISHDSEKGIVAVSDTGCGIPEDMIPKVFDKFYQLDNIDHHSEGTGLGMTISKSIIEQLGGKIWVESQLGKGTTVRFSLPVAKVERLDKRQKGNETHYNIVPSDFQKKPRHSILLVDDEEMYRSIISEYLRDNGYIVYEAENGKDALEKIRKREPEILILDVMMPGMSGLEVCRAVRSDSSVGQTKIVITSAKGQKKEQQEGIVAGADRYLTKPFEIKTLLETVEELIKT